MNRNASKNPFRKLGEAFRDLLNRAREGAGDLPGLRNSSRAQPALQPVPVRAPQRRSRRRTW